MNSIDEDAEIMGINPETWKKFKEMHHVEQPEFEEITAPIDDKEAFIRHKEAMARRAFSWYRLSKKKDKSKLIDIYNRTALMGKQR